MFSISRITVVIICYANERERGREGGREGGGRKRIGSFDRFAMDPV